MALRLFVLLLVMSLAATGFAGDKFDWKPFTPEELNMRNDSFSAGAGAVILDWEIFSDDQNNVQRVYCRIKIFTEEGRSEGDIEIPFVRETMNVTDIRARTIHPDGRVIPFTGNIFEKTIVKTRHIRYPAKTFSLPDVQPGSILEYSYRVTWDPSRLLDTHWDLQQKLPVRHAKFQIRPYKSSLWGLNWSGRGVPAGRTLVRGPDNIYTLEVDNMPALDEEAFAPPEGETKPRIDFYYSSRNYSDPEQFWREIGKDWWATSEKFVGNRESIRNLANSIVQLSDTPEAKLRKLYTRAQQVRNLAYERKKTDEEARREKLKANENIEDVVRHGYGYDRSISLVFLGLVRAAGFEAHVVALSSRRNIFFQRQVEDSRQLNWYVIEVKVGENQYRYFDPGTRYCPFGLLHWTLTGVAGIRLQKEGGAFMTTPDPVSNDAMIEREAVIRSEDGSTKGELTVIYRGQEALIRRLGAIDDDDNARKKDLEDEVKGWLPDGSSAKLASLTGWHNPDDPITAKFAVELQNFGVATGQRLILPLDIFASRTHPAFQHDKRRYPVYFGYPYQEYDRVFFELPPGYQVEKLPANGEKASEYGRYASGWAQAGSKLVMERRFALDWFYFPPDKYNGLKEFFNNVHNSDQENAILHVQK